jgi:hypothetical protein
LSLDNLGSTLAAGAFVTVTISSRALPAYPPSRTIQDAVVVTEDNPSVCPYMLPISELFEGYFFTPPTLAFGDVVVGRTSQLHVTASFSGPDFAGVAAAGPASDFEGMATTSNGGGPNPIAGFDVTFSPSVIGPRTGSVSFAGFTNPVCTADIVLSGNGVAAPPPVCTSLDGGATCGDGGP